MILDIAPFLLLGNYTCKKTVRLVRSMLNEEDNARLFDLTIRNFINVAKSEIGETLMNSSRPDYDYSFYAGSEDITFVNSFNASQIHTTNFTALKVIDLSIPYTINFHGHTSIIPSQWIAKITSMGVLGYGSIVRVNYPELLTISSNPSSVWDYSILWASVGEKIFVYEGSKTIDIVKMGDTPNFTYNITVVRQALPDDLMMTETSYTYNLNVDVPETAMRLLATMVQKMCLEALGKAPVPQLEQTIQALVQALSGSKQGEKQ